MTEFPQPIYKFTSVAAANVATSGDNQMVTTGGATVVVTLPPNVGANATVHVRKVDSGAGAIQLKTSDGSTIDGVVGTTGITTPATIHAGFKVANDGVNWWVVST
jgi:hypothetical protein